MHRITDTDTTNLVTGASTPAVSRRQLLAGMATAGLSPAFYASGALSQDRKILRVRAYGDLQVLDPAFQIKAPEGDIIRNILCGLVSSRPGEEWSWELDGAEVVEQVDDRHIEFTLREGLLWTDGFGDVTAEDVKYSYERIADPRTGSYYQGDWAALDHVEVKNRRSGVIVFKEPFAPLWTTTLPFSSGKIVCRKAMEAVGGRFETKPPAQCGRYVLNEWLPNQRTVLVRNPDWPGQQPVFDEVQILPIEDARTAELAFENGEIEFTWVAVSSIPRYQKHPPRGGKLEIRPSLAYVWLGLNKEVPPFDNLLVRRAVQHGVDVASVLDAAYFGVAEPSTGIIAAGLIGHRDKKLFDFDPKQARALLKQAGYENGVDATLHVQNVAERLTAAQAIQGSLAGIGIRVAIQQIAMGSFSTLGVESRSDSWRKIQLILMRFAMQPDPSWATEWFTPEQIGIWNWERFNSPEFGELHKQAKRESDAKKRHEMYVRMQDIMEESGCYLFLTHESVGVLSRDTVTPVTLPDGTPVFHRFGIA